MMTVPASMYPTAQFPAGRPRRLRRSAAFRRLVSQTHVEPSHLILPLFVKEALTEPQPIASMPGVVQHSMSSLRKATREAADVGLGAVMLFGVPAHRDAIGSGATDPDGILQRAIGEVKDEVGDDLPVMADLCLDEFTDHGHCGVLTTDGRVDNDATLDRYASMAIAQAEAGVDVVGPSGMMDGQVGVIRASLDGAGFNEVAILAYTAKYASSFYGPFRDAVECDLSGDRKTYQQDPANRREALRELALDLAEGADIVMVKPALPYLDIIRDLSDMATVPVAAYQVSGEYAAVEAAVRNGWLDRERAVAETLTSIRRAGADAILTYWALDFARRLV